MFYPSIDMADFTTEGGDVDEGKFVRYWRKGVIEWHNTCEIVALYNEFLKEEVSIRWWQRMEKENRVPVDLKRRWVIARILDLPVMYFGLPIAEIADSYPDEIKLPLPARGTVNIHRYDKRLREVWASPYGNLKEILMRIYVLQDALIHGKQEQREQIARLLCQYFVLSGNIQRGDGNFTSAIFHLDRAVTLAQERRFDELHVKAFYLRGYCYYEKWRFSLNQEQDFRYLLQAMSDADSAKKMVEIDKEGHISSATRSAVLGDWGSTRAYLVQDRKDRQEVLKNLDLQGTIIQSRTFEQDPYFLKIDQNWHTLEKADTYLALNSPRSALEVLDQLPKGDPHKLRRFVTGIITEAEAYTALRQIDVGTAYAIEALKVADEVSSPMHLARIKSFYRSLRNNQTYRRNSDVARLGLELLKVQKPELFH